MKFINLAFIISLVSSLAIQFPASGLKIREIDFKNVESLEFPSSSIDTPIPNRYSESVRLLLDKTRKFQRFFRGSGVDIGAYYCGKSEDEIKRQRINEKQHTTLENFKGYLELCGYDVKFLYCPPVEKRENSDDKSTKRYFFGLTRSNWRYLTQLAKKAEKKDHGGSNQS